MTVYLVFSVEMPGTVLGVYWDAAAARARWPGREIEAWAVDGPSARQAAPGLAIGAAPCLDSVP